MGCMFSQFDSCKVTKGVKLQCLARTEPVLGPPLVNSLLGMSSIKVGRQSLILDPLRGRQCWQFRDWTHLFMSLIV